jgi:hypothetical protein
VFKNRNPPNAANAATEMAIADENAADRKTCRSTSGSVRRGS